MYKDRGTKYTKEILEPIVKESYSIRQVLDKLGIKPDGGHKKLREAIKACDISHFRGKGWSRGQKVLQKTRKPLDIFTSNSTISSWRIRNYLFDFGIKERRCERCKLTHWLDDKHLIPLEVNYIDGDITNNQLSNLEILCPNCHYFTPNYKIKNIRRSGEKVNAKTLKVLASA